LPNTSSEWLEKQDRIEIYLLPVRFLNANPIGNLWRKRKEQVAACLERSLDILLESCKEYFEAPLQSSSSERRDLT